MTRNFYLSATASAPDTLYPRTEDIEQKRTRQESANQGGSCFAFFVLLVLAVVVATVLISPVFLSLFLSRPRFINRSLTDPRVRAARRASGATRRRGSAWTGAARRTTRDEDDDAGAGGIAVVDTPPRTAEAPSIACRFRFLWVVRVAARGACPGFVCDGLNKREKLSAARCDKREEREGVSLLPN